ncbi:hypothetical protein [Actinomadura sp. NPDC049753]|uniref:hypothetical protein n=1 Tax=Actinomadura sp. NPDC049753 TaxID=3154739 RepID=UPI00342C1B1D
MSGDQPDLSGAARWKATRAAPDDLDERKHALEQEISSGDTERLRIGLRQYHRMLYQILTL